MTRAGFIATILVSMGFDPDPSDATLQDGPLEFVASGQVDLTVQKPVLDWMQAHVWAGLQAKRVWDGSHKVIFL